MERPSKRIDESEWLRVKETIERFGRELTVEQKRRVAAAGAWTHGKWVAKNGARCLVGHALDVKREELKLSGAPPHRVLKVAWLGSETAFDQLATCVGTRRAAMICRELMGLNK